MKKIILILIILLAGFESISAQGLVIRRPPGAKPRTSAPKNQTPPKNRNNNRNSVDGNKSKSKGNDSVKGESNSRNNNQTNPKNFYDAIIDQWSLPAYNDFLDMYPDHSLSKQILLRKREMELWNRAESQNTVDSYRQYLAKSTLLHFEKEAQNAISALREQDDELQELAWQEACLRNTIEAFDTFLSTYPYSSHREEVFKIKRNLNAKNEWETNVLPLYDVKAYENFLIVYPDFPGRDEVESYINAEKGKSVYEKGNKIEAFNYFRNVTESKVLNSNRYRDAYNASREEGLYHSFNENTLPYELKEFLDDYPRSRYYSNVSDYYGLSLAYNFDTDSTEDDYEKALYYVTNSESYDLVNQLIKENKKLRKEDLDSRYLKDLEIDDYVDQISHLTNWMVGSQWNLFGVGRAYDKTIGYTTLGWRIGYGNFHSRLNTILEFNIGLVITGQEMINEEDLPIRVKWRINFALHEKFKIVKFGKCWLYADAGVYWNTCRDHKYERPFAFSVGPGLISPFIEWTVFYQQEFGKYSGNLVPKNTYSPWFIGTSIGLNIFYF